jgi:FO synthase
MITFARVRPGRSVTKVWSATRRRAGTTTVEISDASDADVHGALSGGLLPVALGSGTLEPAAWIVPPGEALALGESGVPGWRITVLHQGSRRAVVEALARTGAAFLRTGRSRVAEAARIAALPGIEARVSVFVDSVDDAVAALRAGASDLALRDWATESLGQLRDAVSEVLVERTAFPAGVSLDEMRSSLGPDLLSVALQLVDGRGAARGVTEWAPGKDLRAPAMPRRLSTEWADEGWMRSPGGSGAIRRDIAAILDRSLAGGAPTTSEIEALFGARGAEVEAIAVAADTLRGRAVGDAVTYVTNRNINYTNQCTYRCGFCAFSKGPRSLSLRGDPYLLEIHEVARRAREAWEAGATEVCLQGGIHPSFTGDFYVSVVEAVKEAAPDIHVHGFTPLEVWQGAETLGTSVRAFLERLRDAGLGTLPGTAAEILDDRVRTHLCPDKIRTAQWAEVMLTAHELGIRSTATIMFGHVDDPASWAAHLDVVREIQRCTGGFTEFVPLPFVHMGAPIYLQGRSRPGPTWDEVVLVHAVARIAFDGLIPNIQASWVKLGLDGAGALLRAGVNDLGGTLMDESISRAAGAAHGQSVTIEAMEQAVAAAGRTPVRRTTLYELSPAPRSTIR